MESDFSDIDYWTDDDEDIDFFISSPSPNLEEEARNWLELPEDVISMILRKLGAVEILKNAQNVCSLWRNICKDPWMWRVIDFGYSGDFHDYDYSLDLEKMCRHAVDRSCGELVDINIGNFGTDELLHYISKSSNQLSRLRIACCINVTDAGLIKAVPELPLLEHLEIHFMFLDPETLEAVGRCCPLLKSFKHNCDGYRNPRDGCDKGALAIAENMPNLHHLEIIGNALTNDGLQAILDGCPHLESLDLRMCFHLDMKGQFGSKCAARIKSLKLPHDSLDGYEFSASINYFLETNCGDDSYDSDYPSGFSDNDFLTDDDDNYDFSDSADFDLH